MAKIKLYNLCRHLFRAKRFEYIQHSSSVARTENKVNNLIDLTRYYPPHGRWNLAPSPTILAI